MSRTNPLRKSSQTTNFVSSPITFGARDQYYSFNLDAFKQEDIFNLYPRYRNAANQTQNSFADLWGNPGFIRTWMNIAGKQDNDRSFYTQRQNTPYGAYARRLEDSIGTRTLAGVAANYTTSQDRPNGEWWNKLERPTTNSLSRDLAAYALPKITQDGPFTGLLEHAPNGFLTSIANDFDVAYSGEVNAPTYNYDSNSHRKLTTYWTDRLGANHPLRDIYSRFYSETGQSYWDQVSDLDGTTLKPTVSSIYKDYIANPTTKHINIGTNKFTVLGPVSNSNIKADDGNKVIAASPVMTPVVHRTQRVSDETSDNDDVLRADTVLYPSSVGAYHTNTLDIGNGNSIVYYDSSFKKITSRKGDQIFLPSFGAFNWSIDWIPGYEGNTDGRLNDSWLKGKQWTGGAPLISPIPWDDVIINPKDGKDAKRTQQSYADAMSKFATLPERGDLNSQRNYLYTIFSKRGDSGDSDEFSYTYLNLQADRDGGDPLISRNPVNRLGGVKIVGGKFSENRGAENYSVPSGDKTFFGMDWELWQQLLPKQGSTLANNPAGVNDQIRAAQQQWHTVTFAGGRGNNTFNLGNITDNITNNGLFYPDDASYKISLTHDAYYSPQEILDEGIVFGNVFSSGQEQGSAYVSTVNLNLQAEPNSYSVMIQSADPGVKGNDFFKTVTPWTGLAGYTQKFLKTPLDAQKDWVENYGKKVETLTEKEGYINLIDKLGDPGNKQFNGNETGFSYTIFQAENKPATKIWYDTKLGQVLKFSFTKIFPWIDLASSTISTVKGLIEFFSSKEAEPPRQEVSTTFKEQGLSTGRKAVLINDWNPYAKINLNLPSFSPSDWDAISLAINKPDIISSGNNTNKGAYLEFTYTDSSNGVTSQVDHPLVILENLDKNDSVDKVQIDGGGFAYYTYSFIDPDGANGELVRDEFNPIRSSSLRLFGQLANPEKLLEEDGSISTAITFPSDYRYRSENNFDMRYDAENYSAFFNADSTTGSNHYSRYYLGIQPPTKGLPDNWSTSANLSPLTSNVSLEFDSRTQGWYWQPVLKTVKQRDGSLDAATMLNPTTQDLDYKASKLWINEPRTGWTSFSFNDIDDNVTAYRYSKLATTFYATSTDNDGDGISDGQEEINKRTKFNRELLILDGYAKFVSDINQRLLSDENKLYALTQIQSVKTINDFTVNGVAAKEACLVVFNSVNSDGEPVKKRLVLYKDGEQLMPAIAVDKDLQAITPSTFEFNYIVDPSNPTQRPVFDPSNKDQTVLIRSFAGIYNPATNTTQLFEYVHFPADDPDGLTLDEARQAAKTRELPLNFIANTTLASHLATIESAPENDVITGLFTGKAWLAADSYGDSNFQRKTDKWQWLEGESAGSEFWYVQSPFNFNPATQGSIDNRYANWDPDNLPNYSNSRQGLAIDGRTGLWTPEGGQFGQANDLLGYIAEYEPFTGLPNLV